MTLLDGLLTIILVAGCRMLETWPTLTLLFSWLETNLTLKLNEMLPMKKPNSLQRKMNFCLLKQARKRKFLVDEIRRLTIANILYTAVTMWKMLSLRLLKRSIRISKTEAWIWMLLNLACNTNLYNLEEFNHPISRMPQKKVVLVKKKIRNTTTRKWEMLFFEVNGLCIIILTYHCWLIFFPQFLAGYISSITLL